MVSSPTWKTRSSYKRIFENGLAEQSKEHARRIAELISGLETEASQSHAKDAALDARVEDLVSAIGKLKFNHELGRRLASLDAGHYVSPAATRNRLQQKSEQLRKAKE